MGSEEIQGLTEEWLKRATEGLRSAVIAFQRVFSLPHG